MMTNFFGKNDWRPVWADTALWTIDDKFYDSAAFEIVFSPSRNQYKIKYSGHAPKRHSYYSVAVRKLNEFIKNGHEQ